MPVILHCLTYITDRKSVILVFLISITDRWS